jgi:hypothetical protein
MGSDVLPRCQEISADKSLLCVALAEEVTGPHRWQGDWRSENVRRVCCARRCARIDLTHDLVTIVLR